MRKLDLKLLRDLNQMKIQILTVTLVISTGILYMIGSFLSYDTMVRAKEDFYSRQSLANAFHYSQNAPRSILNRIRDLPGIILLEDRLSEEVSVEFSNETQPTTGLLLSITETLNKIYIESGTAPERMNEIAINSGFARANNLRVGSQLVVIIEGKKISLTVSAIALSPEYVYIFRPGSFLPDDKHYGIFWMSRKSLEPLVNKEGTFNQILFRFSQTSESEKIHTWESIKETMKPYGSLGVQPVTKLPSYSLLEDEFKQLRITGLFIPIIFLSVAAFLLHIIVGRIIDKEREQIATFKAIGMNAEEIGLHYFKLSGLISMIGTLLGVGLGILMGDVFVDLYSQFYKFPNLKLVISPWVILMGMVIGLIAGFMGFWFSFRKIQKMEPSVAMRPPTPDRFTSYSFENWLHIQNPQWKIILRNILKKPIRTLFITIGLSFSMMILILGNFMQGTIDYMMELQFQVIQRETLSLGFRIPVNENILTEFSNQEGILVVEGARTIPVRIHKGNRKEEAVITGLDSDSELRRVLNQDFRKIEVPTDGLLMNLYLAEKLGIHKGDEILVEVLEGKQEEFNMPVVGLVNEILGQGIYIDRRSLNRMVKESYVVNQAFLKVDPIREEELFLLWKDYPMIAGISSKTQLLKTFNELMERSLQATSVFILLFTGIIGIGVIYNTSLITLSERVYELGSLRILGFHVNEIFRILIGELTILILISIPLGCYLGYEFSNAIVNMNDTEGFKLPVKFIPATYAKAIGFTFFTVLVSFYVIHRRLKTMDLLSVLKIRE